MDQICVAKNIFDRKQEGNKKVDRKQIEMTGGRRERIMKLKLRIFSPTANNGDLASEVKNA
jgi:predicted nucleic-acid-binding Zn-ribbon protein